MATIVDALVVTLGLDLSNFTKGKADATKATKTLTAEEKESAKQIEDANKRAGESFKKVRNEVLALLAIFTAGMGIKNFTESTIASAANLGFLAKNLQMSTKDLSAWQRAAERAGGSAEGITAALQDSQQQVAKFKIGQVGEGVQAFLRWGGSVNDLKDGNTYLLARARIVKSMFDVDPARAKLVAQQMGIGDGEFNLIRQGATNILALVDAQKKNSAISEDQAEKALKLKNAWLDFSDRLKYVGTTVLLELMPIFEKWLNKLQSLADWVADHKTDIVKWVDGAVTAVQRFIEWADKAAESVGGWKNVLIALAALKVLSMSSGLLSLAAALLQVGSALGGISTAGVAALPVLAKLLGIAGLALHSENLNSGEGDYLKQHGAQPGQTWTGDAAGDARRAANSGGAFERSKYLMTRLKAAGYTDAQSAGIIGSLLQESRLDPNAVNKKSGAAGIGQWLGSRATAFQEQFGHSLKDSTFGEQVDFMLSELKGSEYQADRRIRNATTPEQAAAIHSQFYERPGAAEANIAQRQAYAREIYAAVGQSNAAAIASQGLGARDLAPAPSNVSTSTSSAETNINGPISIHTQATDAAGIARDLGAELRRFSFTVPQANTGVS
ncbi:hypothetical protein SAMN05445504_2369 [Burkholderia sp. CF099]|nr:hypothetical protein SAMN05445504_2369 [Burkholderia sp. CF099]